MNIQDQHNALKAFATEVVNDAGGDADGFVTSEGILARAAEFGLTKEVSGGPRSERTAPRSSCWRSA